MRLESTYSRIGPRFSVTYSGFSRFWGKRRGPGEQLISEIDRARQV